MIFEIFAKIPKVNFFDEIVFGDFLKNFRFFEKSGNRKLKNRDFQTPTKSESGAPNTLQIARLQSTLVS